MKKNSHGNRFEAIAADGAVDLDHPLNLKRAAWYLNVSGIPASGTQLVDLCGKNPGTLVGYSATVIPWTVTNRGDVGLYGTAGTETVTTAGNILLGASAFTISCWVFATNAGFNAAVFAVNLGGGSGNIWRLQSDGNASPVFQLSKVISFATTTISSDTVWGNNTWYHLIGTVRENGDMRMWVNGVLQTGTTTATSEVFPDTSGSTLNAPGAGRDLLQSSTSIWARGFSDADAAAQYYFDQGNYFSSDSPLRWMSTRTWFVPQVATNFPLLYDYGTDPIIQLWDWAGLY